MNYSDIEQFWADAMPAYAARENAACAQHWDANRIGSKIGYCGNTGKLRIRMDTVLNQLRVHGPATALELSEATGIPVNSMKNILKKLKGQGEIRFNQPGRGGDKPISAIYEVAP
jgi:hypothetical protein